jgi:hypothetical protein
VRRLARDASLAAFLLAAGCGGPREPLLTYYNGEYGLSLRYPAGWRTELTKENGVLNRYFLGPPSGKETKPAVSVMLVASTASKGIDESAQTYLAGNTVASSQEEKRSGAAGRSYSFTSADGATRYSLLLLREQDRLYGLYAQAASPVFEKNRGVLEEMAKSFTLERLADYPVRREEEFGFSLRLPPSWRQTRRFTGGGTLLMQYTSPALAADRSRQTVHAALTLTVEPLEEGTTLAGHYDETLRKLGDNFTILKHDGWTGGYADVMRTETPIAVSVLKRFFRVDGRRAYSLAFECRDDVFARVGRWYDLIASSLKTGDAVEK